ncbi:MAG TPA: metallophosphoesterase [Casimicrobiaceae bacterium]|nr:metallophosphoesterase [Casimicrobiaceae bacterium]
MLRVVQISDTHLSPAKTHFAPNWRPVADWIALKRPDLVIHTGDVTVDGADHEEDMRYCVSLLHELGIPVLAVPGNHDVGDGADPHQPVTAARLARWRRYFGDDHWVHDIEGWRLVGLNALLFGTDTEAEAEQAQWLVRTVSQAGGRRLAWFLHKPLFLDTPDELDIGYWTVKPALRAELMTIVRRFDVALIASGHLHRWHDTIYDGTRYVWAPSSAFLVGPDMNAPPQGVARLGAAIYEFDRDAVSVEFAEIAGLQDYWIDDLVHEVYPPRNRA